MAKKRGFTIVELLLYTAIFTAVMIAFITVLVTVSGVQTKQLASSEVEQQSQFILQQLQYYISAASYIDIPVDTPTSTLNLRMAASTTDPTTISLSNNTIFISQAGVSQALTSNKVKISSLTFTRRANPPGHDSVNIGLTVAYNGNFGQTFSQVFALSVARVSAANFDSPLLPSSTNLTLGNGVSTWASINGQIYFSGANIGIGQSSPNEVLDVNGGVRINTSAAQPTCSAAKRGDIWVTESPLGITDVLSICLKNTGNAYNWVTIVTGG